MSPRRSSLVLPVIGWREWVSLPDLGIEAIKAKVDTGARTSALHAFELDVVSRDGVEYVQFSLRPAQHSIGQGVRVSARLQGWRWVRSSSGTRSHRPVIRTRLRWSERSWPVELTLTNRDAMGFRLLLGRQAIRNRVMVDAGRSFVDRLGPARVAQRGPGGIVSGAVETPRPEPP